MFCRIQSISTPLGSKIWCLVSKVLFTPQLVGKACQLGCPKIEGHLSIQDTLLVHQVCGLHCRDHTKGYTLSGMVVLPQLLSYVHICTCKCTCMDVALLVGTMPGFVTPKAAFGVRCNQDIDVGFYTCTCHSIHVNIRVHSFMHSYMYT